MPTLILTSAVSDRAPHFFLSSLDRPVLGREYAFDRSACYLVVFPAEDVFCPLVPVGDHAVQISGNDGEVDRAFDDLLEMVSRGVCHACEFEESCPEVSAKPFPRLFRFDTTKSKRWRDRRAGPGNLNSPISVETAPEGEDLACEDWEQR